MGPAKKPCSRTSGRSATTSPVAVSTTATRRASGRKTRTTIVSALPSCCLCMPRTENGSPLSPLTIRSISASILFVMTSTHPVVHAMPMVPTRRRTPPDANSSVRARFRPCGPISAAPDRLGSSPSDATEGALSAGALVLVFLRARRRLRRARCACAGLGGGGGRDGRRRFRRRRSRGNGLCRGRSRFRLRGGGSRLRGSSCGRRLRGSRCRGRLRGSGCRSGRCRLCRRRCGWCGRYRLRRSGWCRDRRSGGSRRHWSGGSGLRRSRGSRLHRSRGFRLRGRAGDRCAHSLGGGADGIGRDRGCFRRLRRDLGRSGRRRLRGVGQSGNDITGRGLACRRSHLGGLLDGHPRHLGGDIGGGVRRMRQLVDRPMPELLVPALWTSFLLPELVRAFFDFVLLDRHSVSPRMFDGPGVLAEIPRHARPSAATLRQKNAATAGQRPFVPRQRDGDPATAARQRNSAYAPSCPQAKQ